MVWAMVMVMVWLRVVAPKRGPGSRWRLGWRAGSRWPSVERPILLGEGAFCGGRLDALDELDRGGVDAVALIVVGELLAKEEVAQVAAAARATGHARRHKAVWGGGGAARENGSRA